MQNIVIQSLREAIRHRVVPSIVDAEQYQREGFVAPEAEVYLRETIISLDKVEDFQGSIKEQYLVQFDVYARRDSFPNGVISALYGKADALYAEFDPRNGKESITIEKWDGVEAFVDRLPEIQGVSQEKELFALPVLVYVTIIKQNGASK